MRRLTVMVLAAAFLSLVTIPVTAYGALIRVAADGSGDYPTIQAAIDAANPGDFIQLEDGTYTGAGNRDLDFGGKDVIVMSLNGTPETCIIDCEGSMGDPHRGFLFYSQETAVAMVSGITIVNGYAENGAAVSCVEDSDPTFLNCVFLNGEATVAGGGAYVANSSPMFNECVFEGSTSDGNGGGLFIVSGPMPVISGCRFLGNTAVEGAGLYAHSFSSPHVTFCTFSGNAASAGGGGMYLDQSSTSFMATVTMTGNTAPQGAAIFMDSASSITMNHSIIAFNDISTPVQCGGLSEANLVCCVVFGNTGGDWVDCLAGQDGQMWNLSVDPEFCASDPDTDRNWTIQSDSPCIPTDDCGYRGAWQEGCGTSPVEKSTWGQVKAHFTN